MLKFAWLPMARAHLPQVSGPHMPLLALPSSWCLPVARVSVAAISVLLLPRSSGVKKQQTHESSRPLSIERPGAVHPWVSAQLRNSVQPSHLFIQDPTMPPNPAPNPLTQLEEARRRLEEEEKRASKVPSKQRYGGQRRAGARPGPSRRCHGSVLGWSSPRPEVHTLNHTGGPPAVLGSSFHTALLGDQGLEGQAVITLPWEGERALPLVTPVLLVSVHLPWPSWEAVGFPPWRGTAGGHSVGPPLAAVQAELREVGSGGPALLPSQLHEGEP